MCILSMGKSFKDSLKVLEADIQHANSLASEFKREYDGACLQMRMAYSPVAHFLLFLFQWTDCSLAGTLGLLQILIYKVYLDGTTTMSTHERKASVKEFYGIWFSSKLCFFTLVSKLSYPMLYIYLELPFHYEQALPLSFHVHSVVSVDSF
ncbi:RING/U-box superfamily protein [Rhynchospora pubera]|uniref:RING/U-box superfamily protein n=1 Tax=Rhynchospora pubera TaxID=906938 RepID=A0AAV8F2F6_9POAL|nr:RING/U-box superfamily protein [Rhynchospora pubera]